MSETREFVVPAEDAGRRLDVFLARQLPEWSRSQLQRQIRSGQVTIGSRAAYKAGEEVSAGDRITLRASRQELRAEAEALPLEIVYEDDDLAVVNKPSGMAVHAGAGVKSGTLVNALLYHIQKLSGAGGELRPGIVHRLDKMTSGLVIVAKNDFAHRELASQFKEREISKTYVALVHGRVSSERGEITKSVGRDPVHRVRMKPGGIGAREAVTRYRVLRRFAHFTLVEAQPLTGRTHQIRVHLASIGHPVVGDTLYRAPARIRSAGREEPTLKRNFLHAAAIQFRHPRTGQSTRFEAPLPAELRDFLGLIERAN
ncbi:MAG TPA: RluA family pseudouridine synthase [Terriglobia bacterium]|nr:RluA family pseudouridine synthase [Terriglobia bacterium]